MSDVTPERETRRFVSPLPPNPNLDKQRKLAKSLARDYWRGDPDAIERVNALHPKPPSPEAFALSDAQLVIARSYGFTGWPQLKRKIDALTKSPADLFVEDGRHVGTEGLGGAVRWGHEDALRFAGPLAGGQGAGPGRHPLGDAVQPVAQQPGRAHLVRPADQDQKDGLECVVGQVRVAQ